MKDLSRDYSKIKFSGFDVVKIMYVPLYQTYITTTTLQNIEARGKAVWGTLRGNKDYLRFCDSNPKFLMINSPHPKYRFDKRIEVRIRVIFYKKGKPELDVVGNSLIPVFGIKNTFFMLDRKSGFVRWIESIVYQQFKERIYPEFPAG